MKSQNFVESFSRDLQTRIRELESKLELTEAMADRHESGKDAAVEKIVKQDEVL